MFKIPFEHSSNLCKQKEITAKKKKKKLKKLGYFEIIVSVLVLFLRYFHSTCKKKNNNNTNTKTKPTRIPKQHGTAQRQRSRECRSRPLRQSMYSCFTSAMITLVTWAVQSLSVPQASRQFYPAKPWVAQLCRH